jgi:SAM-dependent methyltransferase
MISEFKFLVKQIWQGSSILRAFLNLRLRQETLVGKTIDIGGGKNSDYLSFMKKTSGVDFFSFDIKTGAQIDFEKDRLPTADGFYDTVLFLNVMEHIFNYQHIANEVVRITKPSGRLVGFVPFLMWYHADHRDFFRYTHEALEKILKEAGAKEITIEAIGQGPFLAAAQMILLSIPKLLRVPVFVALLFCDWIYKLVNGKDFRVYQLGYYFTVTK